MRNWIIFPCKVHWKNYVGTCASNIVTVFKKRATAVKLSCLEKTAFEVKLFLKSLFRRLFANSTLTFYRFEMGFKTIPCFPFSNLEWQFLGSFIKYQHFVLLSTFISQTRVNCTLQRARWRTVHYSVLPTVHYSSFLSLDGYCLLCWN